jgi:predicted Zn-dependent protease
MRLCKVLGMIALLALPVCSARAVESTNTFTFTKVDLELLEQADLLDQRYEKEGMVYHDPALNAYVTQVGLSMLPAGSAPEHVNWHFYILRDPIANAFASPNGSIYVNTGLLSLLENEDQLASVLAHEITHVTDRHAYLGYRDYRKKSAAISFAQFAARMAPGGSNWGASIQLASLMVPVVMAASINGYRRELEKDADIYAFNKLIEGNYEPREMPNTFRLLQRKDEVDLTKLYYHDHPELDDRIHYMNALIEQKGTKPAAPEILAARKMKYQIVTEGVVREDIHLAVLSHRGRTALARSTKLTAFHPDSADNLYYLGESYRALGPWTPHPTDDELTGGGKKEIQSLQRKFTPDEEERELLSKPPGQAVWQDNSRLAEQSYQKALTADPQYAKTYLGLGQLYEKQGKNKDALAAYQKYLELGPSELDKNRIKVRVESLQRVVGQ